MNYVIWEKFPNYAIWDLCYFGKLPCIRSGKVLKLVQAQVYYFRGLSFDFF